MKSILKPLLAAALAAAAIQNVAAIGITPHTPASSWHLASVYNGSIYRPDQNDTYNGTWADPAHIDFSGSSAHSEVSLANTTSKATFRHDNLSLSIADAAYDTASSQSRFYFSLSESVSYTLTGAFQGDVESVEGDYVRTRFLTRLYSLSGSSNESYAFEYTYHYDDGESFDYTLDGAPAAHATYSNIFGSLTGTLAAGNYFLYTDIQLIGYGDASGTGWFQLELESLTPPPPSPAPDAGSTFALLGAGLLGLAALRRRKA